MSPRSGPYYAKVDDGIHAAPLPVLKAPTTKVPVPQTTKEAPTFERAVTRPKRSHAVQTHPRAITKRHPEQSDGLLYSYEAPSVSALLQQDSFYLPLIPDSPWTQTTDRVPLYLRGYSTAPTHMQEVKAKGPVHPTSAGRKEKSPLPDWCRGWDGKDFVPHEAHTDKEINHFRLCEGEAEVDEDWEEVEKDGAEVEEDGAEVVRVPFCSSLPSVLRCGPQENALKERLMMRIRMDNFNRAFEEGKVDIEEFAILPKDKVR